MYNTYIIRAKQSGLSYIHIYLYTYYMHIILYVYITRPFVFGQNKKLQRKKNNTYRYFRKLHPSPRHQLAGPFPISSIVRYPSSYTHIIRIYTVVRFRISQHWGARVLLKAIKRKFHVRSSYV